MNRVYRLQTEGICRVAAMLLEQEQYDQVAECLAVARVVDPKFPGIDKAYAKSLSLIGS